MCEAVTEKQPFEYLLTDIGITVSWEKTVHWRVRPEERKHC